MYDSNPNDAPDFDFFVVGQDRDLLKIFPQHDTAEEWFAECRFGGNRHIRPSQFQELMEVLRDGGFVVGVM